MSECRNCAQKQAEGQVAAAPVAVPQQPVQQQPLAQAPAPQPQYQAVPPPPEPRGYAPAPPPYQTVSYLAPPVQQAQGLPSWLITLLVFGGLLGLGAAFYFLYLPSTKREGSEPVAKVESTEGAQEGVKLPKVNPLTKQLEITGLRITEDARKKLQVRMIVINHSSADMGEVKLNITLSSAAGNGPLTVLGKFPLMVSDLGPMEAKETKGSLQTNLRAYELPDWQFLRATAEIVE